MGQLEPATLLGGASSVNDGVPPPPHQRTMKQVAEAIKKELGLEDSLAMRAIPAEAVELGIEAADGAPFKAQLQAIAVGCGIQTGW